MIEDNPRRHNNKFGGNLLVPVEYETDGDQRNYVVEDHHHHYQHQGQWNDPAKLHHQYAGGKAPSFPDLSLYRV